MELADLVYAVMEALFVATVALMLTSAAGGDSASACGFDDPSGIGFQRAVLNLAFPKALYISSALLQAEQDGLLPDTRNSLNERGLFGFRNAVARLNRLGRKLTDTVTGTPVPAFSVVLIGSMLRTRVVPTEGSIAVRPHWDGPAPGDVVLFTDSVVVGALADGSLDFGTAQAAGLVRLYGNPEAVAALTARLGDLGRNQADLVSKRGYQ